MKDRTQIALVTDKEMEVRYSLVDSSSNYDSTRRRKGSIYYLVSDSNQITIVVDKEMEVRYSLVDSSSNLSSNYDSTRKMEQYIYYLVSDSNQITIVVDKEMEDRCFHVHLSSNYDSTRKRISISSIIYVISCLTSEMQSRYQIHTLFLPINHKYNLSSIFLVESQLEHRLELESTREYLTSISLSIRNTIQILSFPFIVESQLELRLELESTREYLSYFHLLVNYNCNIDSSSNLSSRRRKIDASMYIWVPTMIQQEEGKEVYLLSGIRQ